ncbi:MAG: apolipoprotein A1/A4/E family protein [Tannerellaceae bacterium]|nr:apolipoprotein A1/A4/E family protein [Tannerellaceae bacterium]
MSNNINLEVNKMHHTSHNSNIKFPVWGTMVGDLHKQEDLMNLLSSLRKEELKKVRLVSHTPMGKDMRFYPSLHAAVHAAKEGDLILVWEGVYHESVTINKDDLTVKALSSVAEHRGVQVTGQLAISACNVSLEGLEVTGRTTIATTGGKTVLNNMFLKGNTHITGQGDIHIEKSQVNHLDIRTLLYANVYLSHCSSTTGHSWGIHSLTSSLTMEACDHVSLEHTAGDVMAFGCWFVAPDRDRYVIRSTADAGKLFVFNSSARSEQGVKGEINKTGECEFQFSTLNFNREESVLTGKEVDPDFYITDYYTQEELDSLLDLKVDKTTFEQFRTDNTEVINHLGEELNSRMDTEVEELNETIRTLGEKVDENQDATNRSITDLDTKVEAYKESTDDSVAALDGKVDANKETTEQNVSELDAKVEEYKEKVKNSFQELTGKAKAYKKSNDQAVADLHIKVDANKEDTDQAVTSLDTRVETYRASITNRVSSIVEKAKAYRASNDQAVAGLDEKVDANRKACEQVMEDFQAETAGNFQEVQAELDALEVRKVPYFDDKRILLDNHRNLLGLKTDGEGVNLVMVSQWDIADLGSAHLPLNLNASERPTVQLAGQSGEEAEKIAFLRDVDAVQDAVEELKELAANLVHIELEQVDELPEKGRSHIIYLVPHKSADEKVEYYFEYVWLESIGKYASIGTTEIDLSGYYTQEETDALFAGLSGDMDEAVRNLVESKQDQLIAGDNIILEGRKISAVDTVYQDAELRGLISSLENSKQDQLTAGKNIVISEDNEISAIDTIYDDSALKEALSDLQGEVEKKADAEDIYTKEEMDGKLDEVMAGQADMSFYYTAEQTDGLLDEKQALLIAGDHITITEGNRISAKDMAYDDTAINGRVDTFSSELVQKADTSALSNYLQKTENAASATKLATARTINGVSFNGESNITVPVKFPATGVTTLSSLSSVDITASYDLRFTATANQTLSFAAATDGAECIIAINNTASSAITITFPTTNVQTEETTMSIAAGEIGEISVRYLFSKFVIKVI